MLASQWLFDLYQVLHSAQSTEYSLSSFPSTESIVDLTDTVSQLVSRHLGDPDWDASILQPLLLSTVPLLCTYAHSLSLFHICSVLKAIRSFPPSWTAPWSVHHLHFNTKSQDNTSDNTFSQPLRRKTTDSMNSTSSNMLQNSRVNFARLKELFDPACLQDEWSCLYNNENRDLFISFSPATRTSTETATLWNHWIHYLQLFLDSIIRRIDGLLTQTQLQEPRDKVNHIDVLLSIAFSLVGTWILTVHQKVYWMYI